jgi:hypothetical protein
MPQIELVPLTEGITPDELVQRLSSGWVFVGTFPVRQTNGIIDPSKPMTPDGMMPANVWVRVEPTIPSSAVADLLYELYTAGPVSAELLLNTISRKLLGLPVDELVERIRAATSQESP